MYLMIDKPVQGFAHGDLVCDNPSMVKDKMKKSRFKHKKAEIIILSILAVSLIGLGVLVYSAIRANTGNPIINTQDDVPRISAEETYQAVMEGQALLLDVRPAAQYEAQRVSGAVNIPLSELEARMGELDPGQWYITYCT